MYLPHVEFLNWFINKLIRDMPTVWILKLFQGNRYHVSSLPLCCIFYLCTWNTHTLFFLCYIVICMTILSFSFCLFLLCACHIEQLEVTQQKKLFHPLSSLSPYFKTLLMGQNDVSVKLLKIRSRYLTLN